MRGRRYHWKVVAIASAMVLGATARAQTPLCMIGVPSTTIWSEGRRVSAPFSGTIKTTFVQNLPDGNSIHAVLVTHEARDTADRTMLETVQSCSFSEDGQRHERLTIRVNDPVARTMTNWNAGIGDEPTIARMTHLLDAPQPGPKFTNEELAMLARRQKAFEAGMTYFQKEYKSEDLGMKQISGLAARGSRSTRTIPAGEEGNDKPLMVVTETWRSTDLDMTLYAMQDDPRRGRITMEFENLKLSEPDPAVFAPPAGYKVVDASTNPE